MDRSNVIITFNDGITHDEDDVIVVNSPGGISFVHQNGPYSLYPTVQ